MRSIARRRMIQKEAPFVCSGASFETRRLRRRPQDEGCLGVTLAIDDSVETRPALILFVGEAFGVLAPQFGDDRVSHFARGHDARAVALDVGGSQALGENLCDRRLQIGLASPLPAMSGADPWTGS
jgi:hypothetical protein